MVGRIGGDELAVLLAEQAEPGAAALTQRIRERVPEHRAALGLRTRWDVTIGIASFPEDGDTLEELIAAADRRMYERARDRAAPGVGHARRPRAQPPASALFSRSIIGTGLGSTPRSTARYSDTRSPSSTSDSSRSVALVPIDSTL